MFDEVFDLFNRDRRSRRAGSRRRGLGGIVSRLSGDGYRHDDDQSHDARRLDARGRADDDHDDRDGWNDGERDRTCSRRRDDRSDIDL